MSKSHVFTGPWPHSPIHSPYQRKTGVDLAMPTACLNTPKFENRCSPWCKYTPRQSPAAANPEPAVPNLQHKHVPPHTRPGAPESRPSRRHNSSPVGAVCACPATKIAACNARAEGVFIPHAFSAAAGRGRSRAVGAGSLHGPLGNGARWPQAPQTPAAATLLPWRPHAVRGANDCGRARS